MSTETQKIEETPQVETVPADGVGTPGTVLMVAFSVLGPFSMHLIIPAIKPIQQEYGVGGGTASLLISATLWGIAAATLFYGILADRFGRRPMLLWGLVLFAAGSVLGMVGWSAEVVIAGRVIQGIGGACGMVISRTVIRDRYPRDQGTSILAYLTMAVMIAPILAPAFAGFLVEDFGWRMVFVIASVTGFAVLIWTAMRFPETTREKVEIPNLFSVFEAYLSVLAERRFVFYSLVTTFVMTAFFSMMSGAPHLAEYAWGLSKEALGYYFSMGALGMMVTTFITARLAQKVDNNRLMLTGLGLSMTGPLAVSVLSLAGFDHPAAFFVPMVLMGAGAGLALPTATTGALAIIPRMAGTASGMMTFLQFAVAGVAAQAIGYFDHSTPWVIVVFMVSGLGLALASAFTAIMAKPVSTPSAGE